MKEPSLLKVFKSQKESLVGFFNQFGFDLTVDKINKYTIDIIFCKEDLYVKIFGSRHPNDYPYFVNLIIGKGSYEYPSYEKTGIPLWKIKRKIDNNTDDSEYPFKLVYEGTIADYIKLDMLNFTYKFLQDGTLLL